MFLLFLLLYAGTLSANYNFDGVCFAQHVESGLPRLLFHPNHLLYTFFGRLYWGLERLAGAGRALGALQRLDALLGAGTIALLFDLLARLFGAGPAFAASLAFGTAYGFWLNASDAQAYVPAAFAGVLALRDLCLLKRPRPLRSGLRLGAFALLHQLGAVAAVPLAWSAWRKGGRKAAALTLGTAAALPLAAYALVLRRWPAGGPAETARWFFGNAAPLSPLDPLFHNVAGASGSWLDHVRHLYVQGASWFLGEPCPGLLGTLGPAAAWGLLGWVLWRARKLKGGDASLAASLVLWTGSYLLFLTFTHDRNLGYLIFAFLPLPVLALLALKSAGREKRLVGLVLGGAAACVFVVGASAAARWRRPELNEDLALAEALAERVGPADFLLFGGRSDYPMGRAYLPYFTRVPGTSLIGWLWRGEGGAAELGRRLAEVQAAGGRVFVLSGALDPGELARLESDFHLPPGRLSKALLGLPLEPAGELGNLKLYRLKPGFTPSADF